MHILHAIHTLNPSAGGVVTALNSLVELQAGDGHEISVVSCCKSEEDWIPRGCKNLVAGNAQNGYGYSTHLTRNLASSFWDVAIVHGLWQYHGIAVSQECKTRKTPYTVMPHGMLDPWFKSARPIKHLRKQIYWSVVEKSMLAGASEIWFTSLAEQNKACLSFGCAWRKSRVLALPVQKQTFKIKDNSAGADDKQFLYLGRPDPKKGLEYALNAYHELKSLPIGNGCTIVIAGVSVAEARLDPVLNKWVGCEGITFLGNVRGSKKWNLLKESGILVLASYQENYALSVMEGLSVGLPVLLSRRVDTATDILEDGAGIGCEPDTRSVLEGMKQWLALSVDEKIAMRNAALLCWSARFSKRAVENDWRVAVDQLIAK